MEQSGKRGKGEMLHVKWVKYPMSTYLKGLHDKRYMCQEVESTEK